MAAVALPERLLEEVSRLCRRLPPKVAALVPTLLVDSPDAEGALNLFERLCAGAGGEVLRAFEQDTFLVHYALAAFGCSQYLGETLIQNPDLFGRLRQAPQMERTWGVQDYQEELRRFLAGGGDGEFAARLGRFKKREYVRIMLRDILGLASLAEVTAELSALATALVGRALAECTAAMPAEAGKGKPGFAVLGLGKLGGNELNYNSDVDLLYLFSEAESGSQAGGGARREQFIRLAQRLTEMLSRSTPEGAVYRIDLRLRPQGREGEPAVRLGRALRYYAEEAHDWELQALIKARHVAGDAELARDFIRGVQPRVYRKGLNFAAVETALRSAERIRSGRGARQARSRMAAGVDVKLDRGGIRDIEFLAQCLQRVYGGEEPWLRSSGTLFALQKLHDKRHISGGDFQQLTQAYEFLRRLEHRLQLRHGRQTHRLPPAGAELEVVARSMAAARAGALPPGAESLQATLEQHMRLVAEVYERLLHTQHAIEERTRAAEQFRLARAITADEARDGSYQQLLSRLAVDSGALYQVAARRDLSARARRLLHRFLSSALTSSERYGAVLRSAGAVEQALYVFEASDFLSETLIRHPEEIATIEQIAGAGPAAATGGLALSHTAETPAPGDPRLSSAAAMGGCYREKLALLRRNYRRRVFALGVGDILTPRAVFDSLDLATTAADSAIAAALEIANHELQTGEMEFAILGLGRLGTREFDFGSDADLLFVREESADAVAAARRAGQVVEILAAYTQEGTLFPVDTRLRPLGAEGELVGTPAGLRAYFSAAGEAQAWEALSFTKLRWISGSIPLARRAIVAARTPAEHFASKADFLPRILAMRQRLAQAQRAGESFKTAAGGYYDIDFITGYLLIKHHPPFSGHNTRERLHALAAAGLISDGDCATLDYAAELMRATDHAIRLVAGRGPAALPAAEHARAMVEQIAARQLQTTFAHGLGEELQQAATQVREVFARVLA